MNLLKPFFVYPNKFDDIYERLCRMEDEFTTIDVQVDIKIDGAKRVYLVLDQGVWEEWNLFNIVHKLDFVVNLFIFPWDENKLLVRLEDLKENDNNFSK